MKIRLGKSWWFNGSLYLKSSSLLWHSAFGRMTLSSTTLNEKEILIITIRRITYRR